MEKPNYVKEEITHILSQNFGEWTAKSFNDGYEDQTLPIYLQSAFSLLADLIGKDKAYNKINHVLRKYQMKEFS